MRAQHVNKRSRLGRWLLAGLLCCTAHSATAAWFTVEVLVFERTSGAGLASELWPEQVDEPLVGLSVSADGNNSVGLLNDRKAQDMIQPVARGDLAYRSIAARLARSGRYRPLLHRGWRQPGLSKAQSLPVAIGRGGGAQLTSGAVAAAVRGTIRLYLARYLHLDAHLVYQSAESLNGAPFELRESRRLRSGELHYFDHPVFGMLVRVTPYQPPGGEYLPADQKQPEQPPAPSG